MPTTARRTSSRRRPPAAISAAGLRCSTSNGNFEDNENSLEATLTHEISLRDHLTEQLAVAIKDPMRRMIGAYLVDMVNEAGYLIARNRRCRGPPRHLD